MDSKPRVIFLCTANSVRSQFAEGFMRNYAGQRFEIYSAGLYPKDIHPLAIEVMDELGIGIRGNCAKSVKEFLNDRPFDYIITVCEASARQCPSRFLKQGVHIAWKFGNPDAGSGNYDEKIERFRQVRDQIDAHIKAWLEEYPG